jgi:uncharacterized protein (TIGR03067 family)
MEKDGIVKTLRIRFRAVLLCSAILVALTLRAQSSEDLRELKGDWVQVSVEGDGKRLVSGSNPPTLTIDEAKWIERSAGGESLSTFTIDSTANPKRIDLTIGPSAVGKSMTLAGIYFCASDTLTVALPTAFHGQVDNRRPERFSTKPLDAFVVITYRRATGDRTSTSSAARTSASSHPQWLTDWDAAFRLAKQRHQLVFVDYFSTAYRANDNATPDLLRLRDAEASPIDETPYHSIRRATFPPAPDIEPAFKHPDVLNRLSMFVLLRVDVSRNAVPAAHREYSPPVCVIFDEDQRERYRINARNLDSLYPHRGGPSMTGHSEELDRFRMAAGAFAEAAALFDAKRDLDASFLAANTYSRLRMGEQARAAYEEAKKIAALHSNQAAAQLADVQTAFSFAYSGDPSRAIRLLEEMAKAPVNEENEGAIWLTLGHVDEIEKNTAAALDAYLRAQSVTSPGSATYAEAGRRLRILGERVNR